MNKLYDNYTIRLTNLFNSEMDTIKVGFNFDYGDEYEIAICRVLRKILPLKYGICRGFIMDLDGNQSGDDIIVFDSSLYPTIGLRDKDDYSRKEFIPAEAVYMYLEAKFTLNLDGNGPQSFQKAATQVRNAKKICNNRKGVSFEDLGQVRLPKVEVPWDNPPMRNPVWGGIISSRISDNGRILTDKDEIDKKLNNVNLNFDFEPDLLILNQDVIAIPLFRNQPKPGTSTPSFFSIKNKTDLTSFHTKGDSIGIGIAQIMGALDRINLGKIGWNEVVRNALSN